MPGGFAVFSFAADYRQYFLDASSSNRIELFQILCVIRINIIKSKHERITPIKQGERIIPRLEY